MSGGNTEAGISDVVDWDRLARLSGGDIGQALGRLRLLYGDRHTFGYDPDRRVFWVIKDGRISTLMTAPKPMALGGLLDNARKAVS